MQWIISHSSAILGVLLVVSEAAASVCQLIFPDNKGASGILASVIKGLQGLGAKEPGSN